MKNAHFENCKAVELPPIAPPSNDIAANFRWHSIMNHLIRRESADMFHIAACQKDFVQFM